MVTKAERAVEATLGFLDVSESGVGLFTSEAARDTKPTNIGLIAYNIFAPIVKTPNLVLEIAWDLRT
jgi:hypothetical protein